jgi:serine/threonine protein phosphatase 1
MVETWCEPASGRRIPIERMRRWSLLASTGAVMADRTLIIGDIHGDTDALDALMARLPALDDRDTLVFLGDYLDRGPDSAGVVERVRRSIPARTPAKVVCLRGNHEDAWLKVLDEGWPGFVMPPSNGCGACLDSFAPETPEDERFAALLEGDFFPEDVVAWMRALPHWYEDRRGIYVHAGLPKVGERWLHPSEVEDKQVMLWVRKREFFLDYVGKPVVVGHTVTSTLPPELSAYTPEDPDDLFWAGNCVYAIDTGAGKGGFLTALELPSGAVYESR